MSNKKHSQMSPSSAERWLNCPGSVKLCTPIPQEESSSYAKEGTVAHEVLERCLKNLNLDPYEMEGLEIDDIEVTEEMCEAVDFTKECVLADLEDGGVLSVEQKVNIVPGLIKGTLDIAIIREYDKIIVADFKYGKGLHVSAVDNPQLMLYALPLMKMYDVPEVEIVIYQPRKEDQISRATYTVEQLEDFEKEIHRGIAATQEKDPYISAGDWCRWCRAKAICPQVRTTISKALVEVKGKELIFPDVEGLPTDALIRIMDVKDLVDKWFKAVAAYAKSVVEEGGEIPGYELAKKRAHRKWVNEVEALAEFSDLGDEAFTIKILSPAQMEKKTDKDRVAKLTEVLDTGMTLKKVKEVKAKAKPKPKVKKIKETKSGKRKISKTNV